MGGGAPMDSRHPICRLPAVAVVTVVARVAMVTGMAPGRFDRVKRFDFVFYDFYNDFVEHLFLQFSYGHY